MILAVRCDQESFRSVRFEKGLNVVLADRTDASTEKDSRNGLGKSTLIEIISFCLGGRGRKDGGIFSTKVRGWTYYLDMLIDDQPITVSRNTGEYSSVIVNSRFNYEEAEVSEAELSDTILSVSEWNDFLGKTFFGLHPDDKRQFQPTFRSLISYVIRQGKDAYSIPFEQHRKQLEWDKQVNNAFLLSLAWEDASDLQVMKDERQSLDARARVLATQIKGNPKKLLGQMEADRVHLQQVLHQEEQALRTFRVIPQYRDINEEVDRLTEEIHVLVNGNVADGQLIDLYRTSREEKDDDTSQILRLYNEAGVIFPEAVKRRLEDVNTFHQQVVVNRENFLATEIARLRERVEGRTREIELRGGRRASLMGILETGKALEEYTKLQQRHVEVLTNLRILESQIADIQGLLQRMSQFRIELEQLQQRMRDDYDVRIEQRQRAIGVFNSNSEMIYDVQGTLIINATDVGFKFEVIIKRDGSDGIGNMKVFCYDLMLSELWASKPKSPHFLIHDSIIFDGVDERQVKNALELAAHTSADQNFQYICTLNSDNVPLKEFSEDFDFNQYVRLVLTDDTEEGGLLGVRF